MKIQKIAMVLLAIFVVSMIPLSSVNANTFPSLPTDPVTVTVTTGPGVFPLTVVLSGVSPGYDVSDGPYTGWCADVLTTLNSNQPYLATLISSLDLPAPWDKVNYILNNKQGTATEVQVAIWLILGFTEGQINALGYTVTTTALDMYNDATANGNGFIPAPGQLVAVYCDVVDGQDLLIELQIPGEYEGLTPGFWKTHPELWIGYSTDATFYDVFGVYITINVKGSDPGIYNPTLIEAIAAKGGVNEEKTPPVYDALARHAVAALLNAAHPDVTYPMTEQEIINAVATAISNGDLTDAEPLKNMLDMYNNAGGGIDAHGNPI